MAEKLVLAYSGGLDTSVSIPWIRDHYGYDVIAMCVDVGEGKDLDASQAKGASGRGREVVQDRREGAVCASRSSCRL